MRDWIFNLVAISILISVFSVILPKNKNGSFVKNIFHVIIVFIVLNPFLKGETIFHDISFNSNAEMVLQSNFISNVNSRKIENVCENCTELLKLNGIIDAKIDISYFEDVNQEVVIQKIIVNLKNSVIKTQETNINIIDRTKSLISDYCNVKKDLVEVYV